MVLDVGFVLVKWYPHYVEVVDLSIPLQEPTTAVQNLLPICYANLLLARQNWAIILVVSQHVNLHMPAGTMY